MAGVSVILGAKTSYNEAMCQTGGGAHRMTVPASSTQPNARPDSAILLKYVHVFEIQVAQTAACNAHHEVVSDWRGGSSPHMTAAEFPNSPSHRYLIACMLGVRRSTVSVAAGALQSSWPHSVSAWAYHD